MREYLFFVTCAIFLLACGEISEPIGVTGGSASGTGDGPVCQSTTKIPQCPNCDDGNPCMAGACDAGTCSFAMKHGDCPVFDAGIVVGLGVCESGCCK